MVFELEQKRRPIFYQEGKRAGGSGSEKTNREWTRVHANIELLKNPISCSFVVKIASMSPKTGIFC
jgi:hypothetical protein